MERLRDKCEHPPGGWVWRDDLLGKVVISKTFDGLIDMVKRQRASNRLDIPSDLAQIIEHEICRRLPDRFVKGRKEAMTQEMLSRHEVDRATDVLLQSWVRNGRRLVSEEVARVRSDVCQHCPHNVKLGCLSCRGIDRYLLNWVGHNRRTGYEDLLGGCAYDRCYIMVTVHLHLTELPTTARSLPPECWRNAGGVST